MVAVVAYGTGVRSWHLGAAPLWTDEAESSINALTILQHGVPVGQYLGLPIYENTLTRPWPGSDEYEFRDTSYSDSGLAIYHGWLPLYAIAASFAAHGVRPDTPSSELSVRHTEGEMYRRTLAARVPSVVFGALFLLLIFLAGRELYGSDAGWAALAGAAISATVIKLARQVRYYSLTLALAALCTLLVARLVRTRRRGDFVWAAGAFVLLFHTNLLAFVSACAMFGFLIPHLVRRGAVMNVVVFGGVVAAGVLPWIFATGFLAAAVDRPMARSLLTWTDIFAYTEGRLLFLAIALGTMLWLMVVLRHPGRLPGRVVQPFLQARWPFTLLIMWAVVAFAAFTGFVPAASYFFSRLTLVILVPALLFGAILAAALARAVAPRYSSALAAGLLILLLTATGKAMFWWPAFEGGQPQMFAVVDHLRSLALRPGTRLYADTGVSLPLMFYSGLPIQNIMPVRRAFLDAYPGDLLIVESPRMESLSWAEVQSHLLEQGVPATESDARRMAGWVNRSVVQWQLQGRVARVSPAPRPAPGPPEGLISLQHRKSVAAVREAIKESGNPMFRGFQIEDYTTLWQVFFYRFVNPERRTGEHLNYAARIRDAEAFVFPRGWVLISSASRAVSEPVTTSRDRDFSLTAGSQEFPPPAEAGDGGSVSSAASARYPGRSSPPARPSAP